MLDIAALGMVVDSTKIRHASNELDRFSASSGRAEQAGGRVTGETGRMRRGMDSLAAPLRALGPLLAATFGTAFARQMIDAADRFTSLQARIALVTGEGEEVARVMESLFSMSQRNRQSFEETGGLFARMGSQLKELGLSGADTLKFLDSLQKSIVIGGASSQEAAAGLRQVAQALGRGKLSGDEFISFMENMPGSARLLADALGVPIGQLTEMAKAGALTADVVTKAFIDMNASVTAQFDKMPITVGQAFQQVKNEVFLLTGILNESTGATSGLASAISLYAQYLHGLGDVIKAVIPVVREWLELIGAIIAKIGELTGITDAITGAFAATKTALGGLGQSAQPVLGFLGRVKDGIADWAGASKDAARELPGMAAAARATAEDYRGLADAFGSAADAARDLKGGIGDSDLGGGDFGDQLNMFTGDPRAGIQAEISMWQKMLGGGANDNEIRAVAEQRADLMFEPLRNMARAVQSIFADTFEDIFRGGRINFERLADAGTSIFAQFSGTLASQLLMRPLLTQIEAMSKAGGGSFLGIGGGTWGGIGMVGGNLLMDKLMGPRAGSFADIGSMVGGLAGTAFGPLGMIGGSLLGNLAGGLFGKSSAGPSGRANLTVDNGQFGLGTFATDNGGDPAQMVAQVNAVAANLNAFMSKFSLTAAGSGWVGAMGFGSNSGGVGTPEELLAQALRSGAIQGSGSIGTALRNTRQTSLEGIGADLEFAKLYDELVKLKPEATAVEAEVAALNQQFAEAKTRAAGLGLSVAELDAALARTIANMRTKFNEGVQLAILGILDPDAAAMKQLEQMQEQRRKDAIALGADLVEIDRLSGMERQQLAEQQAEAMKATFDGIRRLIDDMQFGGLSPASSSDRLAAIQEKFMEVEARALGGDAGARAEFDSVARQYLDIARENFASSESFQNIFDRVFGSAQAILGGGSSGIGAANDNVTSAVMTGTDNIVSAIEFLRDDNVQLREQVARLTDTLESLLMGRQAAGGRAS